MVNTLDGYALNITYFEETFEEVTAYIDRNAFSLDYGYLILPRLSLKRSFLLEYTENTTWLSSATSNFINKHRSQSTITLSLTDPITLSLSVRIMDLKVSNVNDVRLVKIKLEEV
jgi:hypothetical protein